MGKRQRAVQKKSGRGGTIVTWLVVAAIVGAIGFGISQMSNIAFDEDDIRVVNFAVLNARQKKQALEAANAARCNCGCGLGLAQCVSTDPNCPIREANIDRINGMVRTAQSSSND